MTKQPEDSLISHLEALRLMLIKCLSALALGLLPMFLLAPYVINALIAVMLRGTPLTLNFFAPLEVFVLQIKTALLLDILICFPYMAKQVWNFVLPALYDKERNFIKSIVLSSSALFIIGVLFCLFVILPFVIRFGLSFAGADIHAVFGINNVISLALWLSLIFGVVFQFPLFAFVLIRAEIVDYNTIKSKRSYIFIGILIISAVLTPPDIISQLLLTLPTYALFEIGLFLANRQKSESPEE